MIMWSKSIKVSKNAHKFIKLRERKLAMETTAKVIAVSGKGGVGKTTLAAAMVRHLTECTKGIFCK